MRLHPSLRASALNVYSTGRGGAGGGWPMCDVLDSASSQWKQEKHLVALMSGNKEPVPGNVCYGAMRAR